MSSSKRESEYPRPRSRSKRNAGRPLIENPEPVRIELLGGFKVSVGSRAIEEDDWQLKKAASLVKLLALSERYRLHRDRVMDSLWPELGPKAAANNLYRTLHSARRVLTVGSNGAGNHYLRLGEGQVTLCPRGQLWVDVEAFEEAALTARRLQEPSAYRAAVDLYAGELLPEDRYEEWAGGRREELRRLYVGLLLELALLCEQRGEHASAIDALRRIVEHDPLHEEAHASLMRLYASSGQPYHALRQYEILGKSLDRELGTQPGAATRSLREQIAAGGVPEASSSGPPRRELPPHNLPVSRTSFVGRERETLEVKRLLAMTGLLTLTGTGGCGKTRLALEVARDLLGAYPDGVWLVELAGLPDGELVPQAVATALEIREQPGLPLTTALARALKSKQMLLVLDNCEHLIGACASLVDELLNACPRLRVLATSREALRVEGETSWRVPSLALPDTDRPAPVESLRGYEAVRLFLDRARSRLPEFELTPANARSVVEICRRLDGIPLAIELATSRVTALAAEQVASRLEDSLRLLTGGDRTVPRHQTLRATLDWSYDLLDERERKLFERLSVFAAGWSLEAAEAVGAGEDIEAEDVLDLLGKLVDKSLVVAEAPHEGELRYRFLEPVRQYAREKLEERGNTNRSRHAHTAYYLALAEKAEPRLTTAEQVVWLQKLDTEHDNLRAALSWTLERDPETALRLVGALWRFWYLWSYLGEGRRWLERALAAGPAATALRARALSGAGHLAWGQGDLDRAAALREESLRLFRQLGDRTGIAASLNGLSFIARMKGDYATARAMSEEALSINRELGDSWSIAQSLFLLGAAAAFQGDHLTARPLLEESVELYREVGERQGLADALGVLGLEALSRDDYVTARPLMEESRTIMESVGYRRGLAKTLAGLGDIHLNEGDFESAHALYVEGLAILEELDDRWWTAWCLEGLAGVAAARERPVRAARLLGAAQALREAISGPRPVAHRAHYERRVAAARAGLDAAAFAAAWSRGRAMTLERAVEYALFEESAPVAGSKQLPASDAHNDLSSRESEVATLVVQGLTNRQIAARLGISEGTAATHVHNILRKLDLRSRAQIVAWVLERERSS